jgi:L-carnitine CoA-transferase
MAKRTDIPKFGVLSGVKVVFAAMSVAGPFAAEMLADMGADVIWIESPLAPDVSRLANAFSEGLATECERRNQRSLCLNIPTPEGREVLFKLLKDADVFLESSKGGQYEKWGLSDEAFWDINPKLVIAHLSGFGLFGDPDFIPRASFDPIAQAFSGIMALQGFADKDPNPSQFLTTDYYAALTTCSAILGALYNAQRTGSGESIDIAQYETALRCGHSNKLPEFLNHQCQSKREGSRNQIYAGWGVYNCKGDSRVYLLILGGAIIKRVCSILGLEHGNEDFPEKITGILHNTHAAELLEGKLAEFCAKYTAKEMEDLFWPQGVPCCRVMQYADMLDHPHYKARGSIVEWTPVEGSPYDLEGQKVRGPACAMRFKKNPSQIWRGCPTIGMDNDDILSEAGLAPETIQAMYDKGVIYKAPPSKKKYKVADL